jgi:hypothetical protein
MFKWKKVYENRFKKIKGKVMDPLDPRRLSLNNLNAKIINE